MAWTYLVWESTETPLRRRLDRIPLKHSGFDRVCTAGANLFQHGLALATE